MLALSLHHKEEEEEKKMKKPSLVGIPWSSIRSSSEIKDRPLKEFKIEIKYSICDQKKY